MFNKYTLVVGSFVLFALLLPLTINQSQNSQELRQRAQSAIGKTLYVSPTGSGNSCTQAAPCAIGQADALVTPGTTILVAPGTYSGNLIFQKGGSAGSFVTWKSQTKHGAIIQGNQATSNQSAVEITQPYIRLQDFAITGAQVRNGVLIAADNVEIIGNHIHDITQWKTDGTGWKGGAGVDTGKAQLSNILIQGNLIHHVGAPGSTEQLVHGMYLASHVTNGRVLNNVIYNVEDFGLHPYDETEASGWQFINNTIANTGRGILQAPNGITRNNIVYNTRGASYDIRGSGNVVSNNLAGGTGSGGNVSGVTTGDPKFVNAAGNDFHIQAGSPAIDKGLAEGAPTTDYDGKPRPQGAGIDMGAFEVGSANSNPSVNPTFPQPTDVTPTLFCLGGVPCTSPDPTTAATPPVGGANPTTNPNPSETMPTTSPATTVTPCESNDASIQHDRKHKKHKKHRGGDDGGFLSKFFEFIMKFLEMLFKMLGIPFPESPNPAPEDPDVTPTAAPEEPQEPTPCPEATQEPEPTAEQPTTEPSSAPSAEPTVSAAPSVSVQPTTNNAQIPAQVLNLANWKLTLPAGSAGKPTEILQPALATYKNDPYFITANGGVRFRAPVNGVTTSGSSYPRSELREMTDNGSKQASWTSSSGTHTMSLDLAITAIPKTKKHVVTGQIHDSGDDVIVIRLEDKKLFVDINGTDGPTLDANYTLGKRFTVKFEVTGGKTNIYYNGATTPAYTLSKSYSGAYFKAGAYTQSNCSTDAGDCSANNYGEAVYYKVEVTHK